MTHLLSELFFNLSNDRDSSDSIYWTVFSRLHSPSDLFFAPKCNLSDRLWLCYFYHRHRAVYISIFAIVIMYFTSWTSFSSFFSLASQIFCPSDYCRCLPWVRLLSWRVGPVARHSWPAQLRSFQSRGDRLLLAFCSLYACFTFPISCLPTSQHWHFFLIYISIDQLLNYILKLQNIKEGLTAWRVTVTSYLQNLAR